MYIDFGLLTKFQRTITWAILYMHTPTLCWGNVKSMKQGTTLSTWTKFLFPISNLRSMFQHVGWLGYSERCSTEKIKCQELQSFSTSYFTQFSYKTFWDQFLYAYFYMGPYTALTIAVLFSLVKACAFKNLVTLCFYAILASHQLYCCEFYSSSILRPLSKDVLWLFSVVWQEQMANILQSARNK